jgi:GDP/UDP-N,N'-diacetylbacillosamine 2-epimerase (hydrolysing)
MRTICAFSGKRGGYGAYLPLMRQIEADSELDLVVMLGDMHASPEFGRTVDEAKRDFPAERIELLETGAGRGDSALIRAENLGACMQEAARVLERRKPDLVLVHGDRGEHLAVALAALTLGIVVAHTQGGDRSGNIDEIQRHAISKLAHVHFPETEEAAERLRRMGEDEWRIHVVGSTYVDRIVQAQYTPSEQARAALGLEADERFLLVLVHPETYLDREENRAAAESVLAAARGTGLRSVVTYPCSDPGYEGVVAALTQVEDDGEFIVRRNIDNEVYLGLMAGAEAMIGNSSAALVEAPYFSLPTVNVGLRQEGRTRDPNVLDANGDRSSLEAAVARSLDPSFRAALRPTNRLGDGRAAERIVAILSDLPLDDRLRRKQLAY